MLSPSVVSLEFERVDGLPLAFKAGQWLNLTLPLPGESIRRAYSIASPPWGASQFEIAVTLVQPTSDIPGGRGSALLHALQPGDVLDASGPHGFFVRDPYSPVSALFIATGTGVTPLRSMAQAAAAASAQASMRLLFGARHEEDILYRDEWRELEKNIDFRADYTLSQPGDLWDGKRGYVQAHVREIWDELTARGKPAHVYICGLKPMVTAVRDLLRNEMQLPREVVHSERYD